MKKKSYFNKGSAFQLRTHSTGVHWRQTKFYRSVSKQHKVRVSWTITALMQVWYSTVLTKLLNDTHKYLKKLSIEISCSILTIWFWKRSHHAHLFNQELDKESAIVKTIKETWDHRQHIRNQRPVHYWSQSKIFKPDLEVNILSWLDLVLV